jgi:hypothetical protein
MDLIIS